MSETITADSNLQIFNPDLGRTITFEQWGEEVLRIAADGRFYVKGREVETDGEVRDIFAAWARQVVGDGALDVDRCVCPECGADWIPK